MPRRPQPPTLRLAAIKAVGRHLERICYGCKNSHETLLLTESDAFLREEGPFVTFPPSLLEDLLQEVCRQRCSALHLHLLIQPQLRKLKVQSGTVHHALHFLQLRCPGLRCIELGSQRDIVPELFIRVFASFPHLVRIDLSDTCIDDRAFDTIGSHCKGLQVLEISHSTVTDNGLRFISQGPKGEHRCPKLTTLGLKGARVSRRGVAALLHYHPALKDLQYEDTIGALAELEALGHPWQGKLDALTCSDSRDIGGDLESALEQNPVFHTLQLKNTTVRSESLYPVMKNTQLRCLELTSNDEFLVEWGEGVAPLLSSVGSSLTSLTLDRLHHVDSSIIGENCPQLVQLSISHVATFAPVMVEGPPVFKKLESLTLLNSYGNHILSTAVRQLLLNCVRLQELHLQLVDTLDDLLWEQVATSNPLQHLVTATFDQCHGISASILFNLVETENQLEMLNVWSCRFVNDQDRDNIKRLIKSGSMDLVFRCMPFLGFQSLPNPPINLPQAGEVIPLIQLE